MVASKLALRTHRRISSVFVCFWPRSSRFVWFLADLFGLSVLFGHGRSSRSFSCFERLWVVGSGVGGYIKAGAEDPLDDLLGLGEDCGHLR